MVIPCGATATIWSVICRRIPGRRAHSALKWYASGTQHSRWFTDAWISCTTQPISLAERKGRWSRQSPYQEKVATSPRGFQNKKHRARRKGWSAEYATRKLHFRARSAPTPAILLLFAPLQQGEAAGMIFMLHENLMLQAANPRIVKTSESLANSWRNRNSFFKSYQIFRKNLPVFQMLANPNVLLWVHEGSQWGAIASTSLKNYQNTKHNLSAPNFFNLTF